MGRRLGEKTRENTKCMVEVNGVRLIDRMLEQLSTLGLSRVIVVEGYQGERLVQHIGHRYEDRLKIEFIHNPVYDRTNNIYSLGLARQQMMEDDTLLLESDLIFDTAMLRLIVEHPYPNLALVAKYETWMDGTMVRLSEDGDIVSFIPKKAFRYSDTEHYYKTCNIYKFSREFSCSRYVPFLEAYSRAMGDNEYYEQVLRVLTALDRTELKALPITTEKWYEIDDVQDLDVAETLFASPREVLGKYGSRYGGYWRFPQMTDFCYLVNPFFPTPKMRDEMRANFDTLLQAYPSGMRVNALLAGKYFGLNQQYIVPGNGAAELIKAYIEGHAHGRVGVVRPTFEEYAARVGQGRVEAFVPQGPDFAYTASEVAHFFAEKEIGTLLIVNPDNPSGNFIPRADILWLATWARERGIELVVDESFVDFADGYPAHTLLTPDTLDAHPNLVVVKSISKSYGVPGLRLGVLASAQSELVAALKRELPIWNLNSFAEFYMQIFGKYEADYAMACTQFAHEREVFARELSQVPYLRVVPSQANYFLCEITNGRQASELAQALLERANVLVKDLSAKPGLEGRQYLRIAIRDRHDNALLVRALMQMS